RNVMDQFRRVGAPLRGGADVKKNEFVGTLLGVAQGNFNRISGIGQVDEIHALDDTAILDVQAGNDTCGCCSFHVCAAFASACQFVSQSLGFGQVKGSFVEASANDGPFDTRFGNLAQGADIVQVMYPARSNDGDVDVLGETLRAFDVDTAQHAVAGNVGEDDGFAAFVFEPFGDVEHVVAAGLAPAVGGHLAIACIQA